MELRTSQWLQETSNQYYQFEHVLVSDKNNVAEAEAKKDGFPSKLVNNFQLLLFQGLLAKPESKLNCEGDMCVAKAKREYVFEDDYSCHEVFDFQKNKYEIECFGLDDEIEVTKIGYSLYRE